MCAGGLSPCGDSYGTEGWRWLWSVIPWSLQGFTAHVSWPGSPAQTRGCLPPGAAFVTEVSAPRPGSIPAPDVWVLHSSDRCSAEGGSRTNRAATQRGSGGMSLCWG